MEEGGGRGKLRDDDGRERRGERRDRGGRKRERRGRDNRDNKDRGKRMERPRPHPIEKQAASPQQTPMKPPIILTKPMAEKVLQESQGKEPVVIAIKKREDPIAPSASILSSSLGASKPINIDSSISQSQTSDLSSSHQEERHDHSQVQLSASAPTQSSSTGVTVNPKVVDHLVTGLAALQATPHATMNHATKVVDEAFHWSDKALSSLLEQTDFIVVGVVGYQGAGKSTILSLLGDGRNKDTTKR
eukprot:Seg2092.2 transcript_id=Seg2092.2/GoldUCD/mRNA.D3Y31 product="Protein SMG9" protein_id=Seg2092.2/GoldUCD/D3Y31